MGHVSNFPTINRNPTPVADFGGEASEFPTDDDIGRLFGTGLDEDFSFLGEALVNDCYRDTDVSVPTNITSLIHADDEAHDKNFSLFFDSHDIFAPILQADPFDIPCPVTNFDSNDPKENFFREKVFNDSEKDKVSDSSPDYFNEQRDNTSSNSTSEPSTVTVNGYKSTQHKREKQRKHLKNNNNSATYNHSNTIASNHKAKKDKSAIKKKINRASKQQNAETHVNDASQTLPKLVIKLTSQTVGKYKSEQKVKSQNAGIYKSERKLKSQDVGLYKLEHKLVSQDSCAYRAERKLSSQGKVEVFAPTIADKVKMGRRGQNGGFNDEDFRQFLENSEAMMKKSRRRRNNNVKELSQDGGYETKQNSPSVESNYTSRSDTSPEYSSQAVCDSTSFANSNVSPIGMLPVIKQEPEDDYFVGDFDLQQLDDVSVKKEMMSPFSDFEEHNLIDVRKEEAQIPEYSPAFTNQKDISISPMPIITSVVSVKKNESTAHSSVTNASQSEFPKANNTKHRPVAPCPSMPKISDLFNFNPGSEITTSEMEVELGEICPMSIVTLLSPAKSKTKSPRKVPSPTESFRTRKSKVPTPEKAKSEKLPRPVVPFKLTPEPKPEPPQRYSLPDTPLCSPLRSPGQQLLYPGTSSNNSSRKRRESSSSSSSSSSSGSSSGSSYEQSHRSPSKKIRSEKLRLFCQRCQRYKFEKRVKYDAATDSLTDEFGRELRPSEREEYKMSCHCGSKSYGNQERRYSRTRSCDPKRNRIRKSRSRSSSSRSNKYTCSGSRERAQRSPSIGNRNKWRERDRPIEERRVLYVGDIPYGMSEASLRERFIGFGPIEDVQIKFKYTNHVQKIFGFITFKHREDAYDAKENGNKDPLLPKFDLNFGGRRKFCNGSYTDLDSNITDIEERRFYGPPVVKKCQDRDLEFEELLQMEKQRLRAKGVSIRQRPPH